MRRGVLVPRRLPVPATGAATPFHRALSLLKYDGTMWLNLGDSFAGGKQGRGDTETRSLLENRPGRHDGYTRTAEGEVKQRPVPVGCKPKDLLMIPARVALALQADGWYLRSEIVWHKPNPMPESVRDRPTKAHEMIYLLAKSQTYYYDAEAIKEPSADARVGTIQPARCMDKILDNVGEMDHATRIALIREREYKATRNRRDVWTVTTKPYKEGPFRHLPA